MLITRGDSIICYDLNVCYNIGNPVRKKVMSFRKALKSTCKCIIIKYLQYCSVKKKYLEFNYHVGWNNHNVIGNSIMEASHVWKLAELSYGKSAP